MNMDIFDVISNYCQTKNPIIYSAVFDNINKCIVSNLQNYTGNKIYDLEDVYDITNLLNCIYTYKFDYVIYKYNCEQQNTIIQNCPNVKFYRMTHFIDDNIFDINPHKNKNIDVLLYGNISSFYPFRKRIFDLIKNHTNINYYEIPFPGYKDNTNINFDNCEDITGKKLADIINSSKFTICTCSSFNYLLKKYFESALCNSVIIGNVPDKDKHIFGNNYIKIENSMSDEKIINIIKSSIENYDTEYIQSIKKNMYNTVKNNYTYKNGVTNFDKFINHIL
jgi:hypothetical protein